ncbi:hypothetical protein PMI37_01243 [Pseudomonas sp. GM80]|nr:hypothetical protein PMI37_01243 [Pseudomonas sp. GM80]
MMSFEIIVFQIVFMTLQIISKRRKEAMRLHKPY